MGLRQRIRPTNSTYVPKYLRAEAAFGFNPPMTAAPPAHNEQIALWGDEARSIGHALQIAQEKKYPVYCQWRGYDIGAIERINSALELGKWYAGMRWGKQGFLVIRKA